ncbi:MAG: hypothetical protein F7C32_03460 [Desulfurococcales archaeon]|nr:hypothetical protein [Desulfurococcales archaeon]
MGRQQTDRTLIYARAENLAIAGVLDLEPSSHPVGQEEYEVDSTELLESLSSLLLAVEYGSLILVYEGLGMPAPIGRLPPLGEYVLSSGCPVERQTRITDKELLQAWANLVLGQTEQAFASLPSGCLPLQYPSNSCLSLFPLFDCKSYFKAKPAPTGKKVKLPPYLQGRV